MPAEAPKRKVWVRRPGASATLVVFGERDVVDDVRETLLRKYGNSLGRVFDAPDILLRLVSRSQSERILGPDEPIERVLETSYPGGQTIDEALIIDVPLHRNTTPPSPHGGPSYHGLHATSLVHAGHREGHVGVYEPRTDYFGPDVHTSSSSPGLSQSQSQPHTHTHSHTHTHNTHNHNNHTYNHSHASASHHLQRHTHAHHLNLHLQAPPTGGTLLATAHHSPSPPQITGSLGVNDGNGNDNNNASNSNSNNSKNNNNNASNNSNNDNNGGGGGSGGNSGSNISPHHHPHSISVLATGQVPPIPNLPSPGSRWQQKDRSERPKLTRQHSTNAQADGSGTFHEHMNQLSLANGGAVSGIANGGNASQQGSGGSNLALVAPIPSGKGEAGFINMADGGSGGSPGAGKAGDAMGNGDGGNAGGTANGTGGSSGGPLISPPPRTASPRPSSPLRNKKLKKISRQMDDEGGAVVRLGPLTVPPINVLIVEDNIINLKLLEAFIKRLKVRWQTAMNGRDAVLKWRTGGFHLVLMDIQLPIMSGLEATREIRRLERVNSIGVFASTPSDSIGNGRDPRSDKLENMSLFKSPVIIVALTASSLQSDRNDALAAGCNDFLTKPVNFVWLEKKIMEWGCMQALIDFDGWRKWKELKLPSLTAQEATEAHGASNDSGSKKKKHGHSKRPSMTSMMSIAHEPTGGVGGDSSETVMTLSPADSTGPGAASDVAANERPTEIVASPPVSLTHPAESAASTATIATPQPANVNVASAA